MLKCPRSPGVMEFVELLLDGSPDKMVPVFRYGIEDVTVLGLLRPAVLPSISWQLLVDLDVALFL